MGPVILLLSACQQGAAPEPIGAEPADTAAAQAVALLDAVALLTRASLDLRGVRPSVAEIEAVEADPAAVESLILAFMEDERFAERVRSLFSEITLTRQDEFPVTASDFGLEDEAAFSASVGDEVLQIISHIAVNDLPWTEVVTGDWTMADPLLAEIWPVDYPAGETGWQRVSYTDERPAVGILATNSLWWRYMSNASNSNRGRANAISKMLLCNDYLDKSIEFDRDVNLLDSEALSDALRSNPDCAACHVTLDPLASYLWGFYYFDYDSPIDTVTYHPEREPMWADYVEAGPSFYGEPGYGLADLGEQLAADPRFVSCAVEQVWEKLIQRDEILEDTAALGAIREAFLDGNLTLKALIEAVLLRDEYRAGPSEDPRYVSTRMVSPDQLASQLEELTGYRLTVDGLDMMRNDAEGLRTLSGGIDGTFVSRRAALPITTMVLVVERLAEAAAWHVVAHDQDNPESALLLTEVDFTEHPDTDPEPMIAQIQLLHLRLLGQRVAADGEEVAANLALWEELADAELSTADAWAGLVSVLLRDPNFLFY